MKSSVQCLAIILGFLPAFVTAKQTVNSHDPVWSPNGEQITFYSNKDGDFEVYILNKDGSGLEQITFNEVHDGSPTWSPTGDQILFNSSRNDRKELYVYSILSRETKQLTATSGNEGASAWSPDGKFIIFESNIDGPRDLYLMNSNGSGVKNLTQSESNDFRPSWSEDSNTIYFNSHRTGAYRLYKMNLEGSVVQLYDGLGQQVSPTIMHGHKKLLFTNHGENSVEIGLLDLETSQVAIIPHGKGDIMLPSFSPDNKEILFVLIEDGTSRICLMNYDTGKRRFLVDF